MSTRTELLLQKLVGQIVSQNAQSVHLTTGQQPIMRKDGKLQLLADSNVLVEDFLLDLAKDLLSEQQLKALNKNREIIVIKEISSLGRFKINFYYQRQTLSLSIKLISNIIPDLSTLNLSDSILQFVNLAKGLVIISGPYDSGRTTLAAALLQAILNSRVARVMTLERPIEYLLISKKGIAEQRQIGRDADSFEDGLKLLSQEKVEAVLVSELATKTVIQSTVELALSGRLVFAVIINNSSIRSIKELISFFDEKTSSYFADNLANALQAVVNLKLLPRQGKVGRVYATEILINNSPVRLAIKDKDYLRLQNILQTSKNEGMLTLDQSLLDLVNKGLIAKETALLEANDPEALKRLIRK